MNPKNKKMANIEHSTHIPTPEELNSGLHGHHHAFGYEAVVRSHKQTAEALGVGVVSRAVAKEVNNGQGKEQASKPTEPQSTQEFWANHYHTRYTKKGQAGIVGRLALSEMPEALQGMVTGYDPEIPRTDKALFEQLIKVRSRQSSTLRKLVPFIKPKQERKEFVVPEETSVNVSQWHNKRLTERHKQFVEQEVPKLKSSFVSKLKASANKGDWLPTNVLDKLKKIERARVYIDDGTNTWAKSILGYEYYTPKGEGVLVLGSQANDHTKLHELTHAMNGHDLLGKEVAEAVAKDDAVPLKTSALYRLSEEGDNYGLTLLNEGLTDVISCNLGYANIAPLNKLGKNSRYASSSYKINLKLVESLCKDGAKPVDVRLFVAAYFEDEADAQRLGDQSAKVKLRTALEESFPKQDIVKDLDQLKQGREYKFMSKIHKRYRRQRRNARIKKLLGKNKVAATE